MLRHAAPFAVMQAYIRLIDALYALGRFKDVAAVMAEAEAKDASFKALPEYKVRAACTAAHTRVSGAVLTSEKCSKFHTRLRPAARWRSALEYSSFSLAVAEVRRCMHAVGLLPAAVVSVLEPRWLRLSSCTSAITSLSGSSCP
jgi:hypothetical protein